MKEFAACGIEQMYSKLYFAFDFGVIFFGEQSFISFESIVTFCVHRHDPSFYIACVLWNERLYLEGLT